MEFVLIICDLSINDLYVRICTTKEADNMQRRLSRIFALALGIPLLLSILAACGSGTTGTGTGSSTPTGSTTIKIATELPVSGKDSSNGKPAENGAHMAIDEANSSNVVPGYKFVFVPKDDVGVSGIHDPTVGAANVRTLIGDALVAGLVGPFNSNVAKAEMPITNQAPLAQISPANTNQCLTKSTPESGCTGSANLIPTLRPTGKVNYFRIATTDDHQGPGGADYLYKTGGYKKAYVIDDAETYGIGIANTFSKEWQSLGGTVLGRSSEPGSTSSYVSPLTQIATKHPDVIYFGGNNSTGGDLIRQQIQQVPVSFLQEQGTSCLCLPMFSLLTSGIPGSVPSESVVYIVDFCVVIAGSVTKGSFECCSFLTIRLTRKMTKNSVKANPAKAPSRLP